jgi:hypothetical protein
MKHIALIESILLAFNPSIEIVHTGLDGASKYITTPRVSEVLKWCTLEEAIKTYPEVASIVDSLEQVIESSKDL